MDAPKLFEMPDDRVDPLLLPAVTVYVQGSCFGSMDAPAGWAAILVFKSVERELSGGLASATANRAEIIAATSALLALKKPCNVMFLTDNNVFQVGVEKLRERQAAGWAKSKNSIVKNSDLWIDFANAAKDHYISSTQLFVQHLTAEQAAFIDRVNALAKSAYEPFVNEHLAARSSSTSERLF